MQRKASQNTMGQVLRNILGDPSLPEPPQSAQIEPDAEEATWREYQKLGWPSGEGDWDKRLMYAF